MSPQSGGIRLVWACLPAPKREVCEKDQKRRQSSTPRDRASKASEASPEAAFSEEESELSERLSVVVYLGTIKGKSGWLPNQQCIKVRKDSSGDLLDPTTLDIDKLNGAINASLRSVDFDRMTSSLWLVELDPRTKKAANMTAILGPDDFVFESSGGASVLRIAIEQREVVTPAGPSSGGKKAWHPLGATSAPREGDGRIQRSQIVPLCKTQWISRGYYFDESNPQHMAALNYHAHGVYNNNVARTEAETQNLVTWLPSTWPGYNPTKAPPPPMGLKPPSAPLIAAALPVQPMGSFDEILRTSQVSHHTEKLRSAGIVEADDLKHATMSDLLEYGLNKFEAARLLRYVTPPSARDA